MKGTFLLKVLETKILSILVLQVPAITGTSYTVYIDSYGAKNILKIYFEIHLGRKRQKIPLSYQWNNFKNYINSKANLKR